MLLPLPRRSDWRYFIAHPTSRISLPRYGRRVGPRIDLFEACSAFTHVAACTLALSPYFVTRLPEGFRHFVTSMPAPVASGWSGCRMGFTPTGKRRLCTAHAMSCPFPMTAILLVVASNALARPVPRHPNSCWLSGRSARPVYKGCARSTPPACTKLPPPRWWIVCSPTLSSRNNQWPLAKIRSSAAAATTSAKQVS